MHRLPRCRRLVLTVLLLVAVLVGCSTAPHAGAARGSGAPPHRAGHTVTGRITAQSGSTWTVVSDDGRSTTVGLTPQTRYGSSHQPTTAAAFTVGATIRVTGTSAGTTLSARRVVAPLGTHPAPTTASPPTPQPAPVVPRPASPGTGTVASAVAAADRTAAGLDGVSLGVAVADRASGQVTLGGGGSTPFESASVVKLFTVVDVLHRSETGDLTLAPDDPATIARALGRSDDAAMDDLWERYGDVTTVTDVVGLAGLQDTAPPSDPDQWGETTTSARDVLAVYRYATTALNPVDRKSVTDALGAASDTGADGFDQAFGLLAAPRPAGAQAKQGWMSDGSLYLHTTGVPATGSPYVVAVLSRQPATESWDTARSVVSSATAALTSRLPAPAP